MPTPMDPIDLALQLVLCVASLVLFVSLLEALYRLWRVCRWGFASPIMRRTWKRGARQYDFSAAR